MLKVFADRANFSRRKSRIPLRCIQATNCERGVTRWKFCGPPLCSLRALWLISS